MTPPGFRIRLTGRQVINWSLISCVIELVILIALRPAHGPAVITTSTWVIAMVIPALDVLLGLRLWQVMRRVVLARFPFFTGVLLGLLAAWTIYGWR